MLGFLPWEKWLPAYVFGPLLCVGAAGVLVFNRGMHWWQTPIYGVGVIFGAWGTWTWFRTGRNIFACGGSDRK